MTFEILPAHDISMAEQAEIFNQAFEGYLAGWNELDASGLARFVCAQGADFCYSRFASLGGNLVGFGYINQTGNVSRLSGMGTVPKARRTGAAAYLLSHLLAEARSRKNEAMVLEVFEQNAPAVALYERAGFKTMMRLFAWRRSVESASAHQAETIEEISLTRASQLPAAPEFPEIPWQISRHALAKVPSAQAFLSGKACIVLGDPSAPSIRIHACFAGERDWNALRNGLAAVVRHFPQREFFAPAIFPEEFGNEIFGSLGFMRESLNQLLMRRDL